MLYSIQFPIGIDPYTMLHLGEKLITNLIATLPTLVDNEDDAINTLRSNLFLLITPNLSHLMGGSRLALLSAEDIPSTLTKAVNRIPSSTSLIGLVHQIFKVPYLSKTPSSK